MPNYAHTHWQGRFDYFSAFSSFFVFSLSLEYPSTVDIRLMQQSDRESVAWKNETNSNEWTRTYIETVCAMGGLNELFFFRFLHSLHSISDEFLFTGDDECCSWKQWSEIIIMLQNVNSLCSRMNERKFLLCCAAYISVPWCLYWKALSCINCNDYAIATMIRN